MVPSWMFVALVVESERREGKLCVFIKTIEEKLMEVVAAFLLPAELVPFSEIIWSKLLFIFMLYTD